MKRALGVLLLGCSLQPGGHGHKAAADAVRHDLETTGKSIDVVRAAIDAAHARHPDDAYDADLGPALATVTFSPHDLSKIADAHLDAPLATDVLGFFTRTVTLSVEIKDHERVTAEDQKILAGDPPELWVFVGPPLQLVEVQHAPRTADVATIRSEPDGTWSNVPYPSLEKLGPTRFIGGLERTGYARRVEAIASLASALAEERTRLLALVH